jgi:hypothetical protein
MHSIGKEGLAASYEGRMAKFYLWSRQMDDIAALWPRVLKEFTRRNLTVASDRASAVLGIASRYAKLSNQTYIGGLWWPHIAHQMKWKQPSHYEGPSASPERLRQTSWAWISVEGVVKWKMRLAHEEPRLKVDLSQFGVEGAVEAGIIPLPVRRF